MEILFSLNNLAKGRGFEMSRKDLEELAKFMAKVEKRFMRGAWCVLALGIIAFFVFNWHVIF
jgi:hypothetical protein